jgi:hypothetical protein
MPTAFKAAVKADEFTALSDDVKALYAKSDFSDDVYVYAKEIDDFAELKAATKKEREARSVIEKELAAKAEFAKQFEGLNPEEIKEAIAFKQQSEEKKLLDEGEFEKIRAKDRDDTKAKLDAKDLEIAERDKFIDKEIFEAKLQSEFIGAGGILEASPDAINSLRAFTKFERKGIETSIKVLDEHGLDAGVSLDEFIKTKFREVKPWFFPASGAAGSGAGGGASGQGRGGSKSRSAMSVQEKSAYIAEHGQESYLKLPQ